MKNVKLLDEIDIIAALAKVYNISVKDIHFLVLHDGRIRVVMEDANEIKGEEEEK